MSRVRSPVSRGRSAERGHLEVRVNRISEACQTFIKGFEEGAFTLKELEEACRLLSTLIGSLDRESGDLCLLASHAETIEQFEPICMMSCERWKMSMDSEGMRRRARARVVKTIEIEG